MAEQAGPTLADVLAKLERMSVVPDRLWTLEDCAEYMQCSQATARRALKQTGAPSPVRVQTDERGTMLPARYIATEVRTYVERSTQASRPARRRRVGSK